MSHHPHSSRHASARESRRAIASRDVIIAGAGPVGLLLACELRLQGCSVLVLERGDTADSPLKQLPFGLRGLSMPSLDALHRRGLLDALVARMQAGDAAGRTAAAAHWMQQPGRPAGHFAGIAFHHDNVDTARWPYHLPGPGGHGMPVTLAALDTVLTRRAAALGVEIRRAAGVEDVTAADHGVTARAGGRDFHGRWLVGCDGGRSTVRKAAGFEFAGTDAEFTGYSIEAELTDPHALRPGRHRTPAGMYTYTRPGTLAMVEFDGGACHRTTALTREHVQAVLRRVSGTGVGIVALHQATTWTDRARQATAYRRGRVLLAGDAAHIHSPLGGQGLNLGIGDAMNLGWKLAATLRGDAPDDLLDSYHAERHPAGARILDWSRAQVALMRPTPGTRALAAILGELIGTRDGATYFAERVWGVSQRDALGDAHPLVGRGMPDFALADGTTAAALLHDGRGVLLAFEADTALDALARGRAARVRHAVGEARDRLGLRALLVRPDGIVAWAADAATPSPAGDADRAARAMARWFGAPDHAGAPR
ncbi:FAD-dependent monooxygenase [Burkholderia plantarii]|uniref:FAD-dependent monooxygenase n=1 Tax=Burkholderia plantarii TaxID=41899 RepID=UPI0009F3F9AE|nr:FAD-dependent monooxygenase [Burkholderia plantarii]